MIHLKFYTIFFRLKAALRTAVFFSVLFVTGTANAQYTTYNVGLGLTRDFVYSSVAPVFPSMPSANGPGYIMSGTFYQIMPGGSTGFWQGTVIRTNSLGTIMWSKDYINRRCRFTHIETYNFRSTIHHLVIGTVLDGALNNNNLLILCIDDNGNIIRTRQIAPPTLKHLCGIKGIPTSDGHFAIVGMETTGYEKFDSKQTVVLKVDSLLNIVKYHVYNTTNVTNDYDMPNGIVEGANANEYFIVGTANKSVIPGGSSVSEPCVMSARIDMLSGAVLWSRNFSTQVIGAHRDAGADCYYNSSDSTLWLLANSSVLHCFNLTQIERVTGNTRNAYNYIDSTLSLDMDNYGFELKPSLSDPANLVVGGWKIMLDSITPVLHEVNKMSGNIVRKNRYKGFRNRMAVFKENNWLYPKAAGQFPFYYNNIMAYKSETDGYAIVGSDTLLNLEAPQLWRSRDVHMRVVCGSVLPFTYKYSWSRYAEPPLTYVASYTPSGTFSLITAPITYSIQRCETSSRKKTTGIENSEPDKEQLRVYPNPSSDRIFIESMNDAVAKIYDVYGRELITQSVKQNSKEVINISSFPAGVYVVRLFSGGKEIAAYKIQVSD